MPALYSLMLSGMSSLFNSMQDETGLTHSRRVVEDDFAGSDDD
jgi:hypothetical protein